MVVKFASAMLRFQQQSQGLIPTMSPTVYEISRRYNIQGMQHLIDELQYPDATLAQCFLTGFNLVGYLQETGIHRSKLSPATENPYRCHHADNKRLVGSIRRRAMKATPEQLADLQECYDKSLQEVTEGWAEAHSVLMICASVSLTASGPCAEMRIDGTRTRQSGRWTMLADQATIKPRTALSPSLARTRTSAAGWQPYSMAC